MKYEPMKNACLSWNHDFGSYLYLIEKHLGRSGALFFSILQKDDWFSSEWKETISKLPQENLVRLLISPNFVEILYTLKDSLNMDQIANLVQKLEDHLAAEFKHAGLPFQHDREIFCTSFGDVSFSEDYIPLQTFNHISIDYNGFIHRLGFSTAEALSYEEAFSHCQQINKALEIIQEISPYTFSLIQNFTNVIHLRKNPSKPNFYSWSTHTGIGKIAACNFEQVSDQIEEVIDFLIHESIHNFLHLMEEEYGPFLTEEAMNSEWLLDKVVPSPWSGKKICLGSYTHAIGVWYGLAHFWKKATGYSGKHSAELTDPKIEWLLEQACIGFVKPENVHKAPGDKGVFLTKDYLEFSSPFQKEIATMASA